MDEEGIRQRKIEESSNEDLLEFNEIIDDIENDIDQLSTVTSRLAKVKTTLRYWGSTCSWHGVPHMAHSLTTTAILLWAIILLCSAVLFVFLVSTTVRQYLQFSKVVHLNAAMGESKFASITFCNANPYKLSKVKQVPELDALLQIYAQALS